MFDLCADFIRNPLRPALARAVPRQTREKRDRRLALRDEFLRIFVTEFIERKTASRSDLDAAFDPSFAAGTKNRKHLASRLEPPLAIRKEFVAGLLDRASVANADQHVLQKSPLHFVIM